MRRRNGGVATSPSAPACRDEGQGDDEASPPANRIQKIATSSTSALDGLCHAHKEAKVLDGTRIEVTREQVQEALGNLRAGDELRIVPEPEDPKNPQAIVVAAQARPRQSGVVSVFSCGTESEDCYGAGGGDVGVPGLAE